MVRVEIVLGDITHEHVDAIASSASRALDGQNGVEAAVRRRGGVEVLEECRRRRDAAYPLGARAGSVIATSPGNLRVNWILHAVGPDYGTAADASELAHCFRELLRVADQLGVGTLAIPAISTGRRGYPVPIAAQIAVRTVRYAPTSLDCVRFVLYDKTRYAAFVRAFVATL